MVSLQQEGAPTAAKYVRTLVARLGQKKKCDCLRIGSYSRVSEDANGMMVSNHLLGLQPRELPPQGLQPRELPPQGRALFASAAWCLHLIDSFPFFHRGAAVKVCFAPFTADHVHHYDVLAPRPARTATWLPLHTLYAYSAACYIATMFSRNY